MIRQSPDEPFPFQLPTPPKMQPLGIQTQYDGNNINTTAQTPGGPVHSQPFGDLLKYMFKQKQGPSPRQQGPTLSEKNRQNEQDGLAKQRAQLEMQARREEMQREADKHRMAMQGPPKKLTPGGGFNMGPARYELDNKNMNAYQREMYLPKGASQVGGYGPGAAPSATPAVAGRVDYHGKVTEDGPQTGPAAVGGARRDPNPNGTGVDFERQRMLQALALSNANYARSQEMAGTK